MAGRHLGVAATATTAAARSRRLADRHGPPRPTGRAVVLVVAPAVAVACRLSPSCRCRRGRCRRASRGRCRRGRCSPWPLPPSPLPLPLSPWPLPSWPLSPLPLPPWPLPAVAVAVVAVAVVAVAVVAVFVAAAGLRVMDGIGTGLCPLAVSTGRRLFLVEIGLCAPQRNRCRPNHWCACRRRRH